MSWLYGEPLNHKPFHHQVGEIDFISDRCDFYNTIYVTTQSSEQPSTQQMMNAVSTLIGYHATVIRPELNGFAGYDILTYEFVSHEEGINIKRELGLSNE